MLQIGVLIVIALRVVMLRIAIPNIIAQSVILMNVVAPFKIHYLRFVKLKKGGKCSLFVKI
jgi:hypothetical protein